MDKRLEAQAPVIFSGAVKTYGTGTNVAAMAIDPAGNPWTADSNQNIEVEVQMNNEVGPAYHLLPVQGPQVMAYAPNGNLYLWSKGSNTLMMLVGLSNYTPQFSLGTFTTITGMAVDSAGNLFVADAGAGSITEMFAAGGAVIPGAATRVWNSGAAGTNGVHDVAVDPSGNIFFTVPAAKQVRELQATGGSVPANAGSIPRGGPYYQPWSIATDYTGNLYVTDLLGFGKGAMVWKVGVSGGNYTSTTVFAQGYGDYGFGPPTVVRFDGKHTMYVADSGLRNVVGFDLTTPVDFGSRLVTLTPGSNQLTLQFTYYGAPLQGQGPLRIVDSTGAASQDFFDLQTGSCKPLLNSYNRPVCTLDVMFKPTKLGVRTASAQFLDQTGNNIFITVPLTGMGSWHYTQLPLALDHPYGLATSPANTLYVGDTLDRRLMDGTGNVLTACGSPVIYGNFAADAAETIYFADTQNNRIRKCTAAGVVSDVGSGFSAPRAVALDSAGNLFVADTGNRQIKKVVLATGAVSGIGSLGALITGVAVDGANNVYVVDQGRQSVTGYLFSSGYISTTSIAYTFNQPYGIAADSAGNLFITDEGTSTLKIFRKSNGSVVSLGGGSSEPIFSHPLGVAVDSNHTVYVADTGNNTVISFPDDVLIVP